MRLRLIALTASAAGLSFAALAGAHHHGAPAINHYVGADGGGTLTAGSSDHEVSWQRCPPEGDCVPHSSGPILKVGDEAPGTTFVATQDGVSTRSNPWRGRLRVAVPPRVEGEVRAGSRVRPVAATWEGGWGREQDSLQLQVCDTPEGGGCFVIADGVSTQCEPNGGRVLGPEHVGRWLRVLNARFDQNQPRSLVLYPAPEAVPPMEPAPGRAAAVVGRIAPGRGELSGCRAFGVRLDFAHLIRAGRDVASVTCPTPCVVTLVVRQGRRVIRLRTAPGRGTFPIRLRRRDVRRLRAGRLHVTAIVNGHVFRTARARLGD